MLVFWFFCCRTISVECSIHNPACVVEKRAPVWICSCRLNNVAVAKVATFCVHNHCFFGTASHVRRVACGVMTAAPPLFSCCCQYEDDLTIVYAVEVVLHLCLILIGNANKRATCGGASGSKCKRTTVTCTKFEPNALHINALLAAKNINMHAVCKRVPPDSQTNGIKLPANQNNMRLPKP